MVVTLQLKPGEFGEFISSVNHDVSVTGSPLEFQYFAESLIRKPYQLDNMLLEVAGTITEIQSDCYPMLVSIKTENSDTLTFAVDEPSRFTFEHKAKIGCRLSVVLLLKPKYRNGDFYYDMRLKSFTSEDF